MVAWRAARMASLSAWRTMTEVLVDFLIILSPVSSWCSSEAFPECSSSFGEPSNFDKIFFFFFFTARVFPGNTSRFFLSILSNTNNTIRNIKDREGRGRKTERTNLSSASYLLGSSSSGSGS